MTNIDINEVMSLTHGFLIDFQNVCIASHWHHGEETVRLSGLNSNELGLFGDVVIKFLSADNNIGFEIKKMAFEQTKLSFLSNPTFVQNILSTNVGDGKRVYDGEKAITALAEELNAFLSAYTNMNNTMLQPVRKIKP